MKRQSNKSIDSSLGKPTTLLAKDDHYIAFSGSFPTGGGSSHPFVFTPYVIKLYAQTPFETQFASGAIKFAEQFDPNEVIVDFPYIHFFKEDFLMLFKLKMKSIPAHY